MGDFVVIFGVVDNCLSGRDVGDRTFRIRARRPVDPQRAKGLDSAAGVGGGICRLMSGQNARAQRPIGPSSHLVRTRQIVLSTARDSAWNNLARGSPGKTASGPAPVTLGDVNTREESSTNRHASRPGTSLRSAASVWTMRVDCSTGQVIASAKIGQSRGRTRQEISPLSVSSMALTAIPAIAPSGKSLTPQASSGALRWLSVTSSRTFPVSMPARRGPHRVRAASVLAPSQRPLGGPPDVIPLTMGALDQGHLDCVLEPARNWKGRDRVGTMGECGMGMIRSA